MRSRKFQMQLWQRALFSRSTRRGGGCGSTPGQWPEVPVAAGGVMQNREWEYPTQAPLRSLWVPFSERLVGRARSLSHARLSCAFPAGPTEGAYRALTR